MFTDAGAHFMQYTQQANSLIVRVQTGKLEHTRISVIISV